MTTQQRYDLGFEKGNEAYHAGARREANPYIEQLPTAEASGWADGWDWGMLHDPNAPDLVEARKFLSALNKVTHSR